MTDTVVRMPKLADTLVEGTVGEWLKHPGDEVESGEPLASIETDKVTTELTSPATGTLLELLVAEGQTVPIDTPIARIGTSAQVASAPTAPPTPPDASRSAPDASPTPPAASRSGLDTSPTPPAASRSAPDASRSAPPDESASPPPRVTPVAARLLAEHHVSPDQVPATARRLTKRDVLDYVRSRERRPGASMRRAIAEHMSRARKAIPHGQTVMAADLTALMAWRDQQSPKPTLTAFFVHALAHTLEPPPAHIGVAVARDNGLIVPVIRNAETLSISDTAQAIADIAERARGNRLAPDATQGATMTVTNVGSFGNVLASPIVPLGQRAILAPGLVERRPLPGPDHGVRLGWQCLLSLVYDRRAFSDLAADRFLRAIVERLVSPTPAAPY